MENQQNLDEIKVNLYDALQKLLEASRIIAEIENKL